MSHHHTPPTDPLEQIAEAVAHAAHLLPAQGPIGVFIHHNTLHAFQHLPFEKAVAEAAQVYGTEPYMSEAAYRDALGSGRIRPEDIAEVLEREAGSPSDVRFRLLTSEWREFSPETVEWNVEQSGLRKTEADRELFAVCSRLTPQPSSPERSAERPRDGILAQTGVDIDDVVNPWLIRLSAAFLDQGLAYWPLPDKEAGLLAAALRVIAQPMAPMSEYLASLPQLCKELAGNGAAPEVIVCRALDALGVDSEARGALIQSELLALRGWAGMVSRLQEEPGLAPHERVNARLIDFLALRMLLTVAAADALLADPAAWQTEVPAGPSTEQRRLAAAASFCSAARILGFTADRTARLQALQAELVGFDDLERRRILHLAYELRHERQILLPMAEHRRRGQMDPSERLSAQVVFCIDEREESIRRHLEELAPDVETFGAAGFFGVAVHYAGIDDAHAVDLCPVVVKPAHQVVERASSGHGDTYEQRMRLRRAWAWIMRHWAISSRTMVRGWVGTTVLGVFNLIPAAARILSPRSYSRTVAWLNGAILPEPRTELAFERKGEAGLEAAEGLLQGFSVVEKTDRVASVLAPMGMCKGMARLVVFLGHGSTSLNNPHESAHDCGACGGRRGGPNARLFAAMANHPEVRLRLRERGVHIPADTWFVGGYHDTCNDDVELLDVDKVPSGHQAELQRLREKLDQARARNAHERARRFEAANSPATFRGGLRHVQARAEHLAEPRPEYGHCTNAVCVVGRRSSTRGLFMDRRSFLVSYDPLQDFDGGNLGRLIGAAMPVCAGISLEYYFSFVDNEGYGCGTKLPHNVIGLNGVMNGYEGDLRTGLPWQMVEIHEPVRILFVIESTPEHVEKTIRANALLAEFFDNRWIRVAAMDPETGQMQIYRDGAWVEVSGESEPLGRAPNSADWYSGHLKHLPLARIEASEKAAA